MEIAFGPVPSRRLGHSLGINNIPAKHCSYSCVYCQVGPTPVTEIAPRAFHSPENILHDVRERMGAVRARGEPVDYLTFVPDGEPTLDITLGAAIDALRPLGLPIAVISNASLLWRPEVRDALLRADWVSVKVDSVDESLWRPINRPHTGLVLADILEGIRAFSRSYRGMLVSETMLVAGINDTEEALAATAGFLRDAGISRSYLSVPLRPPAVKDIRLPDEQAIARAGEIFSAAGVATELLTENEGDAFAFSGDLRKDILDITAVHPLRESALRALVEKSGASMTEVDALIAAGELKAVAHAGEIFYVRRLAPGIP
jgi:wyosine [tRNA(Phe)-imidazoG37] synthetase (radical SAM superfamily)